MAGRSDFKTSAAVLYAPSRPIKLEGLLVPPLRKGQALIKIHYAGICRSQLNIIQGKTGRDPYLPHTLGHEGSGVVEAVGPGVKKVRPGDHVVMTWIKAKGLEGGPTEYRNDQGLGVHSGPVSTFMEYAVVSENRLVKIPKSFPFREAALLGCAVLTGASIVFRSLKIKPKESLAVFGAGGVGLSVIMAARLAHANPIIAVDVSNMKLEKAIRLGATRVVHTGRSKDVLPLLLKHTRGRGVDYAVEASGQRNGMENAFRSVRSHGGVCVIAGNLAHGETIAIDPFELIKGKKITGTWGGESVPDRDIPRYAKYFLDGKLDLGSMIAAEYPLKSLKKAITRFENGLPGRVLIQIGTI